MEAIALEFPLSESESPSTPPRVPRRIRQRLLLDCNKPPPSAEEIEAKLRHAHLRRQKFYSDISSKARSKPRSLSRSSSNVENIGQRLEARLHAAEQKRLNILAKAQMRLARLDELRQAAKTGVEMRFEKERMKLGRKVESRVLKAEANRMRILKAYHQKRATQRERLSQSMMRRIAKESKYKERVCAAIHKKRADAEKKRLGLLEAEKKRVHTRVSQVRQVARSISYQREIERRRMSVRLEDKLQRAKRQRAEFLRLRGRQRDSDRVNWNRMHDEADLLSRKLAKCWKHFARQKRTTLDLASSFEALKINEKHIKSLPFEQLAILIESPAVLRTVKSLLDRLESRLKISRTVATSNPSFILDNIDHLLNRVATPRKKSTLSASSRSREGKKICSARNASRTSAKQSRYPVRIVLSAYMILGHPDAVFNGRGELETALNKAAQEFVTEFELLISVILESPIWSSYEEPDTLLPKCTLRSQLGVFDKAWCSYLNSFVVWKVRDARLLEDDLVRAACQLELSMIQKCKLTPEGDDAVLTHDMKAIQKQVIEDQLLLKEKVRHLSGDTGIERMECALSETRSKYFQAKESGSQIGSPIAHIVSPSSSSSPMAYSISSMESRSNVDGHVEKPRSVARSLFREVNKSEGFVPLAYSRNSLDDHAMENEFIVNEYLHDQHFAFTDSPEDKDENSVKVSIRETMEKAFWDSIMESIKEDKLDSGCIIQLMREVRDALCEMVPESWKAEVMEAVDLETSSQLLKFDNLDIDYLQKMLEFALGTLQKLSAPSKDGEMKNVHLKLLGELHELCQARNESNNLHTVAIVKAIRFILEQIQVLKREIRIARIILMEPLLKGPAGFGYLRQAFAKRYGSAYQAQSSLPLTMQWLSSVSSCKDVEWEEHKYSLSALSLPESFSQGLPPSTSLKTGGSFLFRANPAYPSVAPNTAGCHLPECKGERIDLSVRLGLLKLVNEVVGMTPDVLPETFLLNISRLRTVQAQIQKIIVVCTSILVFRQILVSEENVGGSAEMEIMISKCTEKLLEALDGKEDATGIMEIVGIMSGVGGEGEKADRIELRKSLMARLVSKSLQAGDTVFEKVSGAVYKATRGVVLGGNGLAGIKLAETTLRQIGGGGGGLLRERVVEAARVLVVAASVSVRVHGPWYESIMDHM